MQLYNWLAMDLEVVKNLLPLGDALVGAFVTLATAGFTYIVGRRRQGAEVENLRAEKKTIEAAAGMNHAEASQTLAEAAVMIAAPLVERVKEQQEEIKYLTDRVTWKRGEMNKMRTEIATLKAENELMREKFRLQGEVPPELPPEVKNV